MGEYMNSITKIKQKLFDFAKSNGMLSNEQASMSIGDSSITIVLAAVTMGVGAMICGKIFPQIQGTDTASNETIAAMQATTWDALGLLPIALVIFAAVVIIGVVMYLRQ
ncbi:MAG: major capsid protein [Methanosarcina spindle-shaped virus 1]